MWSKNENCNPNLQLPHIHFSFSRKMLSLQLVIKLISQFSLLVGWTFSQDDSNLKLGRWWFLPASPFQKNHYKRCIHDSVWDMSHSFNPIMTGLLSVHKKLFFKNYEVFWSGVQYRVQTTKTRFCWMTLLFYYESCTVWWAHYSDTCGLSYSLRSSRMIAVLSVTVTCT